MRWRQDAPGSVIADSCPVSADIGPVSGHHYDLAHSPIQRGQASGKGMCAFQLGNAGWPSAALATDLADNVQHSLRSLRRTIDLHDVDAEAFRA